LENETGSLVVVGNWMLENSVFTTGIIPDISEEGIKSNGKSFLEKRLKGLDSP
jgi:hypothetical protein